MKREIKRAVSLILTLCMVLSLPGFAWAEEAAVSVEDITEVQAVSEEQTTASAETSVQTEAVVQTETVAQTEAAAQTEAVVQTEAATQTETQAQTEASTQTETAAQTEAATDAVVIVEDDAADASSDTTSENTETTTEADAEETATETESESETETESGTEETAVPGNIVSFSDADGNIYTATAADVVLSGMTVSVGEPQKSEEEAATTIVYSITLYDADGEEYTGAANVTIPLHKSLEGYTDFTAVVYESGNGAAGGRIL
ncbi:MAG: hypothetical protein LUH53_03085 [Lachnospiraceae bacterium]|nr:hypothetical protein [Lachnospiraceae bacterium]